MDKNSRPKIYGVLGNPAKHSLSPLMHNTAFSYLNLNAEYKIFEKAPDEVESFLRSLSKENVLGLNVTVPYKEKVISFLDYISDEARLIGAVNTIRVSQTGLDGFNTDGEGFVKHISEDLGFSLPGKTVAVIGAGGAARAVTVYLSKKRVRKILLYDADQTKVSLLLGHLKNNFKEIEFEGADSVFGLDIPASDLLINATPIGMKESDTCIVDEKLIRKDLLVYDLVYNPAETKLLNLAKQAGAKTSNGLGMLLYQGVKSFEIWTQERAPVEVMRKALTEAIYK